MSSMDIVAGNCQKSLEASIRPEFHNISSWWLNHPFEKYAGQNGNLPQVGIKIIIFETTT